MKRIPTPPQPANLVLLDEVDSTNLLADRLLAVWGEDETPQETVVVARRQRVGKGREGRRWESPAGGLYATWGAALSRSAMAVLPMAAGAALAEAVEAVHPAAAPGLKWPNDLVAAGGKLGGILAQARVRGEDARAFVGFGVNIEVVPEVALAPLPPTSLAALGFTGDPEAAGWAVVRGFLARIRGLLADRAACRDRWLARSIHRPGETLRVRAGGREVEGVLAGFGAEGELELLVHGERVRFTVADVLSEPGA